MIGITIRNHPDDDEWDDDYNEGDDISWLWSYSSSESSSSLCDDDDDWDKDQASSSSLCSVEASWCAWGQQNNDIEIKRKKKKAMI